MVKITLSSDKETIKDFEELSEKLKKSKSQLFRDMIHYFYKHKNRISNGLLINDE